MRRSLPFVVVCLALVPAAAPAQEFFTLRKRPLSKDNKLSVEIKVANKFEAQKWSPAGRVLVDTTFEGDDRLAFTVTPLEFSKDGKLTRFLRHFTQATRHQYGQPYNLSFHKQSFIYTLKADKDEILTEKGEKLPLGLSLDLETQSIPCDPVRFSWDELLPVKPVETGEAWPISPTRWLQDYEVDLKRAKATGTLKKVAARDGVQWATIDYVVEVPLTGTRFNGRTLPIKDDSVLRYSGVVEMNMDGTGAQHAARGVLQIIAKARGADSEGLDTRVEMALKVEISERCE